MSFFFFPIIQVLLSMVLSSVSFQVLVRANSPVVSVRFVKERVGIFFVP